jgi:hypothetical protein
MSGLTLAISAGLAAAGAGTEAYANHQALQKQDSAAAEGIRRQQAFQKQAENDVQSNIKTAQQNQQNVTNNQKALQDQYTAALQRAAPVQGTNGAVPGASKRYAEGTAAAKAANAKFAGDYAANTAAVGAPSLTQEQTQLGLGDTATKVGQLNSQAAQQNALTQMQVNSIKVNPWLQAAGSVLHGAAAGYGAMAGAAAPATDAYGRLASNPDFLTVPGASAQGLTKIPGL